MEYSQILKDVLISAQAKDYAGYGKFDALNSPALRFLSFNNPWLRLILIQSVKECPFHIRPWLGVRVSRNPKGIALFARAYLFLYEKTRDQNFLNEAKVLLKWLKENPSPRKDSASTQLSWGYNFIWQDVPPFLQWENEPNCIVTVFVGEAFVHAYRVTGEKNFLDDARNIADFFLKELPVLYDKEDERAIGYILGRNDSIVLNAQVLSAALLVKIWKHTGEKELLDVARRQMNFTFKRRTPYDAWFYTDPPGKSLIRHDNYHTGGILDGFLDFFEETQDDRYQEVYWRGLEYYRKNLFEADGAPRWMNDRRFPYDVHGVAQGIISFVKAARFKPNYLNQATKIADWTLKHLYRPQSQDFIYRQGRFLKWNYSLMRWCNAWMARALGELIYKRDLPREEGRRTKDAGNFRPSSLVPRPS